VSASRTHRTQVLPWEGSGTERGEAIGSNHRFSGISVSRPASRRVDCPRHSGPRVGHSSVCDADLATGEDGEDERGWLGYLRGERTRGGSRRPDGEWTAGRAAPSRLLRQLSPISPDHRQCRAADCGVQGQHHLLPRTQSERCSRSSGGWSRPHRRRSGADCRGDGDGQPWHIPDGAVSASTERLPDHASSSDASGRDCPPPLSKEPLDPSDSPYIGVRVHYSLTETGDVRSLDRDVSAWS